MLSTLLRRLSKKGFGQRRSRAFEPDVVELARCYDFDQQRAESKRAIDRLAASFVKFAAVELDRQLSSTEATAALTTYAIRNGLPILRQAVGSESIVTSLSLVEIEYLSSRFVIHTFENLLPERDTLVMLAKGSKLASVLYLPDPNEVDRKIDDLRVFFDTPTVFRRRSRMSSR